MASRRKPARKAQRSPRAKPPTPKPKPKTPGPRPAPKGGAKRPVSRAQARLYGVVSRKGSRSTGKAAGVARAEMNRPEARSSLRGVVVSTLPPRKRSMSTRPKPDPAPTPTARPRPKRTRTPAQLAATRRANARRAAGL
jgi:hypothetical protein